MVKRLFFDNLYYVARSAKNRLAACGVNFLSFFRKKFTPSDGPAHKGRKAVFGLFFKKQTEPLGEEIKVTGWSDLTPERQNTIREELADYLKDFVIPTKESSINEFKKFVGLMPPKSSC